MPPPLAPETPEQMAADKAEKAAGENKKMEAAQRILEANEAEATNGDTYGLLRMGERYRDADGVPKDLSKARDYLSRAAQAGDMTASNELEQLSFVSGGK
jgi:TPR repeat protein